MTDDERKAKQREAMRKWREKNKERSLENGRRSSRKAAQKAIESDKEAFLEARRAAGRRYYEKHKEERKRYREENKDRFSPMYKELNAKWRGSNLERIKCRQAEYYHNNKEEISTRKRAASNSFPEKRMWNNARRRARERGTDFDLDVSDIVVPSVCPYLLEPFSGVDGKGCKPFSMSLDRIDNTKGYVKGNVEVISKAANSIKLNHSLEDLKWMLGRMLARLEALTS